jgi:MSHA pilin protein MshD
MCITEPQLLPTRTKPPRLQRGVSLIELVVFIVIVSTSIVGILKALDNANRSSTDPMVRKQALAIAEALLEEVQLQPFTYCDPDDVNAGTALSAADCTGGAGGANDENKLPLGPEAGETRTSSTTPFDNVSDYNGFSMVSGITDLSGTALSGLDAYSASVTVANQALGSVPASDSLLITVSVTGPANTTVVLHGYRTRYAPNALP